CGFQRHQHQGLCACAGARQWRCRHGEHRGARLDRDSGADTGVEWIAGTHATPGGAGVHLHGDPQELQAVLRGRERGRQGARQPVHQQSDALARGPESGQVPVRQRAHGRGFLPVRDAEVGGQIQHRCSRGTGRVADADVGTSEGAVGDRVRRNARQARAERVMNSGTPNVGAGGRLSGWLDKRLPIRAFIESQLTEYYPPKNLNAWYYFGVMALVVLAIQFVTGIFLAMHYKPDTATAFESVERLMR